MKFIKLTSLQTSKPVFINPDFIGHLYQVPEKMSYGRVETEAIYITSDEEIKEGDWCLSKLNEVVRFGKKFTSSLYKKIILTTDQDLIKDGVQAIDDEFLEWFVNNPSCESVQVDKNWNYPLTYNCGCHNS